MNPARARVKEMYVKARWAQHPVLAFRVFAGFSASPDMAGYDGGKAVAAGGMTDHA